MTALTPFSPVVPPTIASPWAPGRNLSRIAVEDIFGHFAGVRLMPITRAHAVRVPAVARARHVLCSTIGRIPLRGYRGEELLNGPAEPAWIEQTTGPLSPYHRMLWTIDDLMFYGWSCWWRTNAADGFPLRCDRLPMNQWSFDAYGNVLVDRLDGRGFAPAAAGPGGDVIVIPGMHEGLLSFGDEAIRHAADLQRAAGQAAKHPAAYLAIKQTGGDDMTDAEIDALLDRWVEAREGHRHGGVGFLNQSTDIKEIGTFDAHLLIEGRNAAAVDIARIASLPADLIDATTAADLTYKNSRDNDRRAVDYGYGGYMAAVSGALSQDAVTPRGQRVAFDLEEWLEGTVPGQPAADDGTTPAAPGAPAAPAVAALPTIPPSLEQPA